MIETQQVHLNPGEHRPQTYHDDADFPSKMMIQIIFTLNKLTLVKYMKE